MALSLSSVLHYWSSRYGHIPVVGGKPTHTRASTARLVDIASQQVVEVPAATPRDTEKVTISGEERAALLLEMARTNRILHSADLANAAWVKRGVGSTSFVSNNSIAPDGSLTADKITVNGAGDDFYQLVTGFSASVTLCSSFWIRVLSAGTGNIKVVNPNDAAQSFSFTPPAPAVWTRVSGTFSSTAGGGGGIQIHSVDASGWTFEIWGLQQEPGGKASSYIPTVAAVVTRSADGFSWDISYVPQAAMYYSRHVEAGTIAMAGLERLWAIGAESGAAVRLLCYATASGFYAAYHETALGNVSAALAAAPPIGATVESVLVHNGNGSVEIVQSINGAAVSSAGPSAALALGSEFSDKKLWPNSMGSLYVGANNFTDFKVVKFADVVASTAQARMDELRNFELGPNRELLAAA